MDLAGTDVPPWVAWLLFTAGAIITLVGAWRALIAPGIRGIRQIGQFLDDWYGDPDRHRPGVLSRIHTIEGQVQAVHAQTQRNSGASMRDSVERIEETLARHVREAQRHIERIDQLERNHDCHHHDHHQPPPSEQP